MVRLVAAERHPLQEEGAEALLWSPQKVEAAFQEALESLA